MRKTPLLLAACLGLAVALASSAGTSASPGSIFQDEKE
jgi:hypothetical protein